MRFSPFNIGVSLILMLTGLTVEARWFSAKEAPLLVKKLVRETFVKADGSFRETWTWHLRVQGRQAREEVGTRTIPFYKNYEEVKILSARTLTKGKARDLQAQDIMERSVTDESPGFSSLHEWVLSFPDVQENSEIQFRYEVKVHRALEPGFWGQNFVIDSGVYEDFRWKIESEKPLFQSLQDLRGLVEVKSFTKKSLHHLEFRSKKGFSLALTDENPPHLSTEKHLHLSASVLKDWPEYGRFSAKAFAEKLKGRYHPEDEKFAESLRQLKNPEERIQKILQRIHSRFRYFGDWRATEHLSIPRSFEEINRTLYGDCKDFALISVKLLGLAGLVAEPVWILNTETPPSAADYQIPTDNAFNHVIILVRFGEQTWWVDPTNPAARVRFLSDEIAGRPVLILRPEGSELTTIRPLLPDDYQARFEMEVWPQSPTAARFALRVNYGGYSQVSAGERHVEEGSVTYLENLIRRSLPLAAVPRFSVQKLDEDRESGDLREVLLQGEAENFWIRAGGHLGFSPLREEVIELLRTVRLTDRAGDLALGKVYAYDEKVTLFGVKTKGELIPNCEVLSPWVDYRQKVKATEKGFEFESSLRLKKSELVLTEQTQAQAFKLQKDLQNCAGRHLQLLELR